MQGYKKQIESKRNFRALELLLAAYPILGQYVYGGFHLELFILLILDVLALQRKKGLLKCKPLIWFSAIAIIHEIVVFIITGANNQTHFNNIISIIIYIVSVFIIAPAVDFRRLSGAINIISIFCMLGLVYHFLMIQTGHSVTPIQILPDPGSKSRLHEVGYRPVSFFWEPATYILYMMLPLFISLIERRFVFSAIIIFTVLLSTSTNGIVFAFIIIAGYALTQKISKSLKIGIVIMGIFFAYFLFNSSLFESGVEKINETEYEHTSRLYNGPTILEGLPKEHLIFGIPRFNVYEYYAHTDNLRGVYLIEKHNEIFLPTFYLIIVKYGILAFAFYLWLLIYIAVKSRRLWPYLLVIVVSMFSQTAVLNLSWTNTMIFMFSFIAYDTKWQSLETQGQQILKKSFKNENTYSHNPIC